MANRLLFTPIKPHFFQPLLPGFRHHLTIPLAFFVKYIEGRNLGKTAKLTSNASDREWEVKIDGRTLGGGWEEFAVAHAFSIGDIVVFKHEGNMVFHVTGFGPCCCDIQYAPFRRRNDHGFDITEVNDGIKDDIIDAKNAKDKNIIGDVSTKKKVKKILEPSSDPSCFVMRVTASNLDADVVFLPTCFARSNGLNKRRCEIVLMNEKGRMWTLSLRNLKSSDRACLTRGWKSFCLENGLSAGGSFTFKLVWNGTKPSLHLKNRTVFGNNSILKNRSEAKEKQSLPIEPKNNEKSGPGECSKKRNEKKNRTFWRFSSVPRQNRFVTLTLVPSSVLQCRLRLPKQFTRVNGINKPGEIILLDKEGLKWPIKLFQEKDGRMYLGKGWKDFYEANGIKTGESFVFELIWEETTAMLKLCSKVKTE